MFIIGDEDTSTCDMDIHGRFILMKNTPSCPINPGERFRAIAFSLGVLPYQWFKCSGRTLLMFTLDGLVDQKGNKYPGVLYKLLRGEEQIKEVIIRDSL